MTQSRQRHLLDPEQVRRDYERRASEDGVATASAPRGMSLTQVQRWVIAAAAVSTLLHLAGGLALAAMYVEPGRVDARIGLNAIASAFGVLSVAAGFMIHQRSPWTWWLSLGLLPGLIGLWLTFG